MGLYSYLCDGCNKNFDIRHPYKEKLQACPYCKEKNPKKILNNPIKIVNKRKKLSPDKPGSIVKDNIQSAKSEVKKEKLKYKKRIKK